jgi:NADPH:quinone reductase-like Zn-dependent oxidoreductase
VVTPAAVSIDAVIRHPGRDVAGEVRGLTGVRGVDVVYDAVGG